MTQHDPESAGLLGLPGCEVGSAEYVVLPLPFEGTVSYGRGTARGPQAVLDASAQVELWDDECDVDLDSCQIHTLPALTAERDEDVKSYLDRVQVTARRRGDAVTIGIGGEHSLTPPLVRAAWGQDDLSRLTIVQIDAHTDLRDEYEGSAYSHACAMRRLTEAGAELIAVGIRASCREERDYLAGHRGIDVYRAQQLALQPDTEAQLLRRLRSLQGDVYLTVDLDGLCPSLCPGTGTPEPGGLSWWSTLTYLRALLLESSARLIGCDFVETVPIEGTCVNEFTTARLIGKCLAYRIRQQHTAS